MPSDHPLGHREDRRARDHDRVALTDAGILDATATRIEESRGRVLHVGVRTQIGCAFGYRHRILTHEPPVARVVLAGAEVIETRRRIEILPCELHRVRW